MVKWEKDKVLVIPKALRDMEMPKNIRAMEKIGNVAAQLLMKRITTKGVDGYGVKLPPLADTGWFFTAPHDGRFGGKLTKIGGHPRTEQRPIQIYEDGYPALKRAMGEHPKRSGSLTGAMWANLRPALKRRGIFGWDIILQFGKSQKVGKQATGKFKELKRPRKVKKVLAGSNQYGERFEMVKMTRVPVLKTVSIKNRTKARELQKVDGRWAFTLLSFTEKEMQLLTGLYLKLVAKNEAFKMK